MFKTFVKNPFGFQHSLRYFCYKPVRRDFVGKDRRKSQNENNKETSKSSPATSTTGTSLAGQLRSKILATGPITVADYMKEVLINPTRGYYMNRDVFGSEGDFITSPEINQIFGELVAIWCLTEWRKLSSPSPFQIIELGPGRGTLSRDILRVLSHFKLSRQFDMHLVEISPFLSKIQAQKLCINYTENDQSKEENHRYYRKGETLAGTNIYWYRDLDEVPRNFSIILAHEFFDALPIHKLQKDGNSWKEILVDVDPKDEKRFRLIMSKSETPAVKVFQSFQEENDTRNCLEYSLETHKLMNAIVDRIHEDGGIGLIMDYGHFGEKTDTFRAFRKHKLHDPLEEPGTADLTADVDFKFLKRIAEEGDKIMTYGPVEQGEFLKKMEGDARLEVLLENSLPENREKIKSGYEMLTHPNQMGKRYKFFSLFPAIMQEHLKRFPVSGFS